MGSVADLLAALTAVRATIDEARERMAAGAEKFADAYAALSIAFQGSTNVKTASALGRVASVAERVAEADEHTDMALPSSWSTRRP